jgi:hypothetical protein
MGTISPTGLAPDEISAARHAGFTDSIQYMGAGRRERIMSSYLEQDQRGERNVGKFVEGE